MIEDYSSGEEEGSSHFLRQQRERIQQDFEHVIQLVSGEMLSEIKQDPDYLLKIQRKQQVIEAICVKKITIDNFRE